MGYEPRNTAIDHNGRKVQGSWGFQDVESDHKINTLQALHNCTVTNIIYRYSYAYFTSYIPKRSQV